MSDAPPLQHSQREHRQAEGPAVDQLGFLDLLYAIPLGDLAMRVSGAELDQVSLAAWSALTVIVATIVLSWIGLHKNRAELTDENKLRHLPAGQIPFWSLRFVQFLIEIVIIGMYFAMGLFLKLPTANQSPVGPPAEDWLTGLLLLIFGLYLVWDCLDKRLAKTDPQWRETASRGLIVTLISLAPLVAIYVAAVATRPRSAVPVIAINIFLVIFLYSYRYAQDRCGNCRAPAGHQNKLVAG
jgi:hypothetical protein